MFMNAIWFINVVLIDVKKESKYISNYSNKLNFLIITYQKYLLVLEVNHT